MSYLFYCVVLVVPLGLPRGVLEQENAGVARILDGWEHAEKQNVQLEGTRLRGRSSVGYRVYNAEAERWQSSGVRVQRGGRAQHTVTRC